MLVKGQMAASWYPNNLRTTWISSVPWCSLRDRQCSSSGPAGPGTSPSHTVSTLQCCCSETCRCYIPLQWKTPKHLNCKQGLSNCHFIHGITAVWKCIQRNARFLWGSQSEGKVFHTQGQRLQWQDRWLGPTRFQRCSFELYLNSPRKKVR